MTTTPSPLAQAWAKEPWTYDDGTLNMYAADGSVVARIVGRDKSAAGFAEAHANGHRIASLSAECARLAATIRRVEALSDYFTQHGGDSSWWYSSKLDEALEPRP